jgi:SAM-dependent methyltransferase
MLPQAEPRENDHGRGLAERVHLLACPACRSRLAGGRDAVTCPSCGARYPVENDIVRFVGTDTFYEGAYQGTIRYLPAQTRISRLGLYLVSTHYLYWVEQYVPQGARLLELGAGGGVRFFARHARTTALDVSFGSLGLLDPGYELALQADALHLPVAEGAYDAAASAYFYEHIATADKPKLLAELRRALRPGGRVVFLFDVASYNPLFRWLRRDEQKFHECFVEHDHHYGLERATESLRGFEQAGFRVIGRHTANKTPLQYLAVYGWTRPYGHPLTTALAGGAGLLSRQPLLSKAYTAGITLFDDLVEPLLPDDWARIMLVALERV